MLVDFLTTYGFFFSFSVLLQPTFLYFNHNLHIHYNKIMLGIKQIKGFL